MNLKRFGRRNTSGASDTVAFNNLMIKLVTELRPQLGDAPAAIEFGNQTIRAKGGMLAKARRFLHVNGLPFDATAFDEVVRRYGAGDLDRLTEFYFRAIGFASYTAIDVNSRHGSLVMDLNENLGTVYDFTEQYDLVTNNGTGEHIFDQGAVFRNAHELTRPGGFMIHCLPCNNYVNHGFFSFSPILFMDLAAVNDYDIVKITVASRTGSEAGYVSPTLSPRFDLGGPALALADLQPRVSDRHFRQYAIGWLRNFLGIRRDKGPFALERALRGLSKRYPKTLIVAVLRKRGVDGFRNPIQGRYGGNNIESDVLRGRYATD